MKLQIKKKLEDILSLIDQKVTVNATNFVSMDLSHIKKSQSQTKDAFSLKWGETKHESSDHAAHTEFHKKWYLDLYGFKTEKELADFLKTKSIILDAGAGKCGKTAWFAKLSPETLVVAADIGESLIESAEYYKDYDNMVFVQCDISTMPFFKDNLFDFVSCDQVLHHTSDPFKTLQELLRVAKHNNELALYVYRKKALPRELLDDYFRDYCKTMSHEELMNLSKQITELGKVLDSDKTILNIPDIPKLGIKGGKMTVQRFIYWNLLKCFWNEKLGYKNSVMINYDWYSPEQAFRYSEEEFRGWIKKLNLKEVFFHQEEACFSGRWSKI